jgi:peptidoglycan/xylan/chitin deacetylase (PgdA/CDA1 family)
MGVNQTMSRLKSLGKKALFGLYKYSGAARVWEARLWRTGQGFLCILLFHRVTDAIPEDGLTVGTARFRAICRMLRRHFRVVPLAEVFDTARGRRPPAPRTVAVTFDDCYHDNLWAARVLQEFGLPACFFVPTGYIGTDLVLPWDRHLPRMPNLDWDAVRTMAAMGFEIGSHSVTHRNLRAASPVQAWEEVVNSKAEIERQLHRPVRWFAYPFGGREHFRPEWVPLLQEAGYEGCVSAHGGFVRAGADGFVLPRVAVPPFKSILQLELFLSGSLDWFYRRKQHWAPCEPAVPATADAPAAESAEVSHAVSL